MRNKLSPKCSSITANSIRLCTTLKFTKQTPPQLFKFLCSWLWACTRWWTGKSKSIYVSKDDCFCLKSKPSWICRFSQPSSSRHVRNIGNSEQRNILKTIEQLFLPVNIIWSFCYKRKFLKNILFFLNEEQQRGIPQRLFDKFIHCFFAYH